MLTTAEIWWTAHTWCICSVTWPYDMVEFKAPVYAGDYIEAYGEIEKIGNTSRTMRFEARKVVVARTDISASAADELDEPIVVCVAHGTCVTPKDCQRKKIEK